MIIVFPAIKNIEGQTEFDEILVERQNLKDNQLVVVKFYTTWSPPCNKIIDSYRELAYDVRGHATLVELNIDAPVNQDVIQSNFISCIPTFHFYKLNKDNGICEKIEDKDLKGLSSERNQLKDLEKLIRDLRE